MRSSITDRTLDVDDARLLGGLRSPDGASNPLVGVLPRARVEYIASKASTSLKKASNSSGGDVILDMSRVFTVEIVQQRR